MQLKDLDLLVSLKVALLPPGAWTYEEVGLALGLSASATHSSVRRSAAAGLLAPPEDWGKRPPPTSRPCSFIQHGVRYAFYAVPGELPRGMPTAHSAPPLNAEIAEVDVPLVWPDPEGEARGQALQPLSEVLPK